MKKGFKLKIVKGTGAKKSNETEKYEKKALGKFKEKWPEIYDRYVKKKN